MLTGAATFQTLDSEELVPLSTSMSDLIRALSDLCIQAYQQLLSITEQRLHNIIGAATLAMPVLHPPPPTSSLTSSFSSRSSCSAGEREHSGSVGIYGEAGDIQEAF